MADFTSLDGRDVELVVNELSDVNSKSKRVSSYVLRDPTLETKCLCLMILTTCLNGMMVIYCIQSYKLCYNVMHHQLLQTIISDKRNMRLLVITLTVQLFISLSSQVLNSRI